VSINHHLRERYTPDVLGSLSLPHREGAVSPALKKVID
jgi:hypothetical protein